MAMVAAKCTECGAAIEIDNTKKAGICSHCGTAFVTQDAINNYNYSTVNNITNNITKIVNGKDSDDAEDFFNRGLTNLKLDKLDTALKNFEQAIDKAPEIAKYYFYVAYISSDKMENINTFESKMSNFYKLAKKEDFENLSKEYGLDFEKGIDFVKKQLYVRHIKDDKCQKIFGFGEIDKTYKQIMEKLSKEQKEEIMPNIESWLKELAKKNSQYLVKEIAEYNVQNKLSTNAEEFLTMKKEFHNLGINENNELYTCYALGYDIDSIRKRAKELDDKNEKLFDRNKKIGELDEKKEKIGKKVGKVALSALIPAIIVAVVVAIICKGSTDSGVVEAYFVFAGLGFVAAFLAPIIIYALISSIRQGLIENKKEELLKNDKD